MKYAIIEDGGKQFKAVEGSLIEVDHYQADIGEKIDLERVLLLVEDENVIIGSPFIPGARVEATVTSHIKGPKVVIFKYKPKIRYRVKKGHRQRYTQLMIDSIVMESGGNNGS